MSATTIPELVAAWVTDALKDDDTRWRFERDGIRRIAAPTGESIMVIRNTEWDRAAAQVLRRDFGTPGLYALVTPPLDAPEVTAYIVARKDAEC